jgi:hypothetical protein
MKENSLTALRARPVVSALIAALPEGAVLIGADVTERSAGI